MEKRHRVKKKNKHVKLLYRKSSKKDLTERKFYGDKWQNRGGQSEGLHWTVSETKKIKIEFFLSEDFDGSWLAKVRSLVGMFISTLNVFISWLLV